MNFVIFTDSSANLSDNIQKEYNINIIPLSYTLDDITFPCPPLSEFDADSYYKSVKNKRPQTSMINIAEYIKHWEPYLKNGNDILHLCMSSGISGTCQAAMRAADFLTEEYPDRKIVVFDTLAASLGEGMQVIYAADCARKNHTLCETEKKLYQYRAKIRQVFTVDDLFYLHHGGRLSGASAILGSVLNIKPLLLGNEDGKIVSFAKSRGRKTAVKALAEDYAKHADLDSPTVYITDAACRDDSENLVSLIKEINPCAEFVTESYEPVTGGHVGPGALALFYVKKD